MLAIAGQTAGPNWLTFFKVNPCVSTPPPQHFCATIFQLHGQRRALVFDKKNKAYISSLPRLFSI